MADTGSDQFRGAVGGAAGLAVVAVLIRRFAAGAGALDKAVGQEQLLFRIEGLGDRPRGDVVVVLEALVDRLAPVAVFLGVGGVEIVKADEEAGAVPLVLLPDSVDLLLGGDAQFFGGQHDGGAVGIVGTDIQAVVPAGFLETHPDVGLHLLQQVSQVQGAIGIGQCAGNQDFAWGVAAMCHCVRVEKGALL